MRRFYPWTLLAALIVAYSGCFQNPSSPAFLPPGASLSQPSPTPTPETFNTAGRPFFQYDAAGDYYYCEPWNYDQPANAGRTYPLVIFLHGAGGAGNISYLSYLGYDTDDGNDNQRALDFQTNHPSFVLVPQTDSYWDNTALITLTESFKNAYRIDTTRIYLIGYSMGGSGSYAFANAYYDYNGHVFAGIIRLAGQSQTSVRDAIAAQTFIWLHIGLDDTAERVEVTRQAYDFLKAYHTTAIETSSPANVPNVTGTTLTLTVNGDARVKKTEYENVGHGIAVLPFGDPDVIELLYRQQLVH